MPSEREIIADEIERMMKSMSLLNNDDLRRATHEMGRFVYVHSSQVIAALRAKDREDGAPQHVVDALKREAQDQAFRRKLADDTYASLKERLCRAAHLAFAGNDRALRRLVDTLENPKPIYGSAALPLTPKESGDA